MGLPRLAYPHPLAPLWIRPEKRESGIFRFNMDFSGDSLAKRSEDSH